MRARAALAALAAALLAACDDGWTITRSDPGGMAVRSAVASVAGREPFPVEVHGAPFPRVTADAVAEALAPPGDWPRQTRFRATPPAPHGPQARWRLALWFNPRGAPDPIALCRTESLLPVAPPRDQGFAVTAAFCQGERRMASAHLEAAEARATEPESLSRPMTRLLATLSDDD